MKKNMILSGAFVAMLCLFGISNVNAQDFNTVVVDYCQINDFKKPNHFYGRGIGQSRDRQTAREQARSAALAELGECLKPDVKAYIKNLKNSRQLEDNEIDEETIDKKSGSVCERIVELNNGNLDPICEKTMSGKNSVGKTVYQVTYLIEYDATYLKKQAAECMKMMKMIKGNAALNDLDQEYQNAFKNR